MSAQQTPGVVIGGAKKKHKLHAGPRIRAGLLVVLPIVILFVIAGGVYLFINHKNGTVKTSQRTSQQELINNVQNAIGYSSDPATLISKTTELINGAKDGHYRISDSQLALAYAARADAEVNSQKYADAVSDYNEAGKLNPSSQAGLDYRLFVARYKNGERKTLISLLNQMIADSKKQTDDDFAGANQVKYQQYIDDLNAGKDLTL